jgi:hypothetical protein
MMMFWSVIANSSSERHHKGMRQKPTASVAIQAEKSSISPTETWSTVATATALMVEVSAMTADTQAATLKSGGTVTSFGRPLQMTCSPNRESRLMRLAGSMERCRR